MSQCIACELKMYVELYRDQLVLCEDKVYKFLGIKNEPEDLYYILKDLHGKILLHSCVGEIVSLFDRISDTQYNNLYSTFELNDYGEKIVDDESESLKCFCDKT